MITASCKICDLFTHGAPKSSLGTCPEQIGFGKYDGFVEGEKLVGGYRQKNPWSRGKNPTTHSTHMMLSLGIKPRQNCWEASPVTTAPSLLHNDVNDALDDLWNYNLHHSSHLKD